ncbi:MAG: hypothetical protein HY690_03525 [Chloroflexi bacterium]|nr:hypothetical protein [Chloroflexota bacterium]
MVMAIVGMLFVFGGLMLGLLLLGMLVGGLEVESELDVEPFEHESPPPGEERERARAGERG